MDPDQLRDLARRVAWTVEQGGISADASARAAVDFLRSRGWFPGYADADLLQAAELGQTFREAGILLWEAADSATLGQIQEASGLPVQRSTVPVYFGAVVRDSQGRTTTHYRTISANFDPTQSREEILETLAESGPAWLSDHYEGLGEASAWVQVGVGPVF